MITADTLKTLTSFTAAALTRAVQQAGYTQDTFESAKFLGITNGGQFCYSVTYEDIHEETIVQTKVFLTYDAANGTVSADY
jgi:hypothetical protein